MDYFAQKRQFIIILYALYSMHAARLHAHVCIVIMYIIYRNCNNNVYA